MRVLFEKALAQLPKEKAKEIWNLYIQFETQYGDFAAVSKLELRKQQTYNLPPGIIY